MQFFYIELIYMAYTPLGEDPPKIDSGINSLSAHIFQPEATYDGRFNFEEQRDEGVEEKAKEKETGQKKATRGGRKTKRRKRRKKKSRKKRKKRTYRRRRKKGRKTKRKR